MWCQVLGRPDVTDAGDFVALGGDSLAAVAVTGRIRDGLGIEIGIGTVFDHPTLAELSAFLEAAAAGPA
jgi:acyl carrier protein